MADAKIKRENFFVRLLRGTLRVLLFPVVLIYVRGKKKKSKAAPNGVYNLSQLDNLSGFDFANFLKSLLENMGYRVSFVGTFSKGSLLLCEKGDAKILTLSVSSESCVGADIIHDALAARQKCDANSIMIVSNNFFSTETENIAESKGINLADRIVLENILKRYRGTVCKTSSSFSCLDERVKNRICEKYRFWI